jgi:hypothetical protein
MRRPPLKSSLLHLALDQQQFVFPDLGALGFPQLVEHRHFELRAAVVEL